MIPCLCPRCSDKPSPTYSEEFRRQCEARWVLKRDRDERKAFYVAVAKHRGQQAADQLVADVKAEYDRERGEHAIPL